MQCQSIYNQTKNFRESHLLYSANSREIAKMPVRPRSAWNE